VKNFVLTAIATVFLSGCLTTASHQRAYDRAEVTRQLVKQGKMAESEKIMATIKDLISPKEIGPAKAGGIRTGLKAERIRTALVMYKGAKALEAGLIPKDKYDEIYIQARARFAELDQVTDSWIRRNRAQNAKNWANSLLAHSNYLDHIEPKGQPWTTIMCYDWSFGITTCTAQ